MFRWKTRRLVHNDRGWRCYHGERGGPDRFVLRAVIVCSYPTGYGRAQRCYWTIGPSIRSCCIAEPSERQAFWAGVAARIDALDAANVSKADRAEIQRRLPEFIKQLEDVVPNDGTADRAHEGGEHQPTGADRPTASDAHRNRGGDPAREHRGEARRAPGRGARKCLPGFHECAGAHEQQLPSKPASRTAAQKTAQIVLTRYERSLRALVRMASRQLDGIEELLRLAPLLDPVVQASGAASACRRRTTAARRTEPSTATPPDARAPRARGGQTSTSKKPGRGKRAA